MFSSHKTCRVNRVTQKNKITVPFIRDIIFVKDMRYFFLCFTLLCVGCNVVPPERIQIFQDAISAYEAGEYRQSAALYEQLVEQGVRSGTVYYNLGNAWAKTDEPVRAVAAYYLAQRYIPNDPRLNANLRAVLASNGGAPPSSETSLVAYLFFWQDWVGINAKIWGSIVFAVLTFLGGVSCGLPGGSRRPALMRTTIFVTILTAIALASTGYDWYRFEAVERIIVTTNAMPRKGNSEQYEPAFVSPIPFGTLAVILDERNGWYSLRFSNGQEGWLPYSQTFRLRYQTEIPRAVAPIENL